jgi:hypothetical protein
MREIDAPMSNSLPDAADATNRPVSSSRLPALTGQLPLKTRQSLLVSSPHAPECVTFACARRHGQNDSSIDAN